MTLAEGLVGYFDYLVRARAKLLDWVRAVPASVYTQTFPVGHGSIRATLVHIAAVEWGYAEVLAKGEITAEHFRRDNPFMVEQLAEFEPFVAAWERQRPVTRRALADLGDPARPASMIARGATPPVRYQLTAGGCAGHILFHEIHHRAQVMAMLRQAGVAAENLDYSVLMMQRIPLT